MLNSHVSKKKKGVFLKKNNDNVLFRYWPKFSEMAGN